MAVALADSLRVCKVCLVSANPLGQRRDAVEIPATGTMGFMPTHCLIENDGHVAVDQNAVFQVGAHSLGQDHPFQIASLANEVLDRIPIADADGVPGPDGAPSRSAVT